MNELIGLLNVFIKIAGYSLILFGIWLSFAPIILPYFKQRQENRTRRAAQANEKNESNPKKQTGIFVHIELLLSATSKNFISARQVYNFIFLMVLLAVITFVVAFVWVDELLLSAVLALLIGVFPYTIKHVQLRSIRNKSSLSFLKNFQVLFSSYQSSSHDVYFAIFNVLELIKEPTLNQALYKLAKAMQTDRSRQSFHNAERIFVYTLNSHYAKRFGKLVITAYLNDKDISLSLQDLNRDINLRKIAMENEKTKVMDSVLLGYLPPFILAFAFYILFQVKQTYDLGYYLTLKENLTLLVICIILSIISVMIAYVLSQPKSDN